MARGKKYVLRWVEEHAEAGAARSRTVYGTYREACNELAKIQATRCDERTMPTVGQLYESRYLPWLERKYEGSESSTPNSYKRAWDSVCARRWADVPIDQIKPLEVQGWLDGMAYGNAHWALVCHAPHARLRRPTSTRYQRIHSDANTRCRVNLPSTRRTCIR